MILSGKSSITRSCASRNYKNNLPQLCHVTIFINIVHVGRINHPRLVVKGNVVRTKVYHKYIKDLKLNIIIDLDRFIY